MGQACCSKNDSGSKDGSNMELLSSIDDDPEYSVSATVSDNANLRVINNWCKAVEANNEHLCKTLLASNPRLELQNVLVNRETGERAFHIAVRNRNTTLVELLGYYGAEINVLSRQSRESPLHIASSMNDVTLIQLCLYFGSDPQLPNGKGILPNDLCRENLQGEFSTDQISKIKEMNSPPTWNGSKRDFYLSFKRDEIKNRGNLIITSFGRIVGCEVDEIGMCCQRLDINKKSQIWNKVSPNKEITNKQADINKILVVLTAAALKIKKLSKKPNPQQVLKLNTFIKQKMPSLDGKPSLSKQDFNEKMHKWLYEIHNSPEWQSAP